MKVLFIQKEGGIFGAENYHLKIIPALIKSGVDIQFLRLYTNYQGGEGGAFIERLSAIGIKTHEINIGRLPKLTSLFKIKKLINNGNFDLVHSHLIHADLHLSLIKMFLGGISCPWVSTKHGYDNSFTAKFGFDATKQKNTPYFMLSRLSERLCDRSYTISNGLRDFFIKTGLTKSDKMEMIHYGFDFPETGDDLKDDNFRCFENQIVIAGRLVAFKGHHYLIEAMSKLSQKLSKVGLVIVGSGQEERKLMDQVQALGLHDKVRFTGYSNEVIKWMYNSDLVAIPSISEGFGVVFLEAFNCKKPVISWDVPAGNELMEDEKTGFLVKAYEVQNLADKIHQILTNPILAEKVGMNAYHQLKRYYTLERMTSETLGFYQSVLK